MRCSRNSAEPTGVSVHLDEGARSSGDAGRESSSVNRMSRVRFAPTESPAIQGRGRTLRTMRCDSLPIRADNGRPCPGAGLRGRNLIYRGKLPPDSRAVGQRNICRNDAFGGCAHALQRRHVAYRGASLCDDIFNAVIEYRCCDLFACAYACWPRSLQARDGLPDSATCCAVGND